MTPVQELALKAIGAILTALFGWVWRIEKRLTTHEVVMYGEKNSESFVSTMKTVVTRLEEHGRLIQRVADQLAVLQREHDHDLHRRTET